MRARASASKVRIAAAMIVAGVLLAGDAQAGSWYQRDDLGAVSFDVIVLRPLRISALIIGAACFVPAVIMSAPMGREGFDTSLETFVTAPYDGAFRRPLGDF